MEERCAVLVSDLYANIPPDERFQVIVSNPPYIPKKDLPGLQAEVQQEPLAPWTEAKMAWTFTGAS